MDARILIVDDNADLVETLRMMLETEGYQNIESCGDGESAWSRLLAAVEGSASMPDLMLLDLMMPIVDGLTLLGRIRADERFAMLPVIVLTVQTDAAMRIKALKAGANDYLAKPLEMVELLARVRTLLGWKMAERMQQRKMEHMIEAGRTLLSTLDLNSVLQRVMQIATVEIDAEGGSIWLEMTDGSLECRVAFGAGAQRLVGIRMAAGQGIAGWSQQQRQSVLVANVHADSRFFAQADAHTGTLTRNLIAVPLLVRKTSIGVLEVINKRRGQFTPADLEWLEVLSPMAAAAIANAQLFEALRQRTLELQARNEELDAFAHTVAHDLQNPLSLIMGFAEVIEDQFDMLPEDEVKANLRKIGQFAHKMSRIVEELLLLAQVRKMEVRMVPLDMTSIMAEVQQRLAYMVEEYQAELTLPTKWPLALGYGPWIEEVWINYISNAIKYGGQPPRVELGSTLLSNGQVRFWVRDNGPGIPLEKQGQLFRQFKQFDQLRASGHGLGLSIVLRIMDRLGGQVGVESQVGQGSTFSFTLPAMIG